jgi:hypothetical protein
VWDKRGKLQLLPNISVPGAEIGDTRANDVNKDGLVVGQTSVVNDGVASLAGTHAVCWRNGNPRMLKTLGSRTEGSFEHEGEAISVNDAGVIVGYVKRFVKGGDAGQRAVRWDENGDVTELEPFDEDPAGFAFARAFLVNERGTAYGLASKYNPVVPPDVLQYQNDRFPCLWKSNSTRPVALQFLGVDTFGQTKAGVSAVNDDDIAVGFCDEYDGDHKRIGQHAVQWDGDGKLKRFKELDDRSDSSADGLNAHGIVVGACSVGGSFHAVYWTADGEIVDLNSLIDPENGWTLTGADKISDDGWVIGEAEWLPRGGGDADRVMSIFRIHVPSLSKEAAR